MRNTADREAASRLISLLSAAGPLHPDAAAVARSLGFDPGEPFCIAMLSGDVAVSLTAPCWVAVGTGDSTVVLVQGADSAELAAEVEPLSAEAVAGISAVRPGLDGARLAVQDARQALALARARGTTVLWESCWWLAVLTEHVEQLRAVVTPTWTFASANAHLAEAVEAYADESFSSTRAARRLFVHPNTVLYRLRQWHRNTGLNPSGISGLAASVASVELGRLVEQTENGTPPAVS